MQAISVSGEACYCSSATPNRDVVLFLNGLASHQESPKIMLLFYLFSYAEEEAVF